MSVELDDPIPTDEIIKRLRFIVKNDKTEYVHRGQGKRAYNRDGELPTDGTIWNTPRKIAKFLIEQMEYQGVTVSPKPVAVPGDPTDD